MTHRVRILPTITALSFAASAAHAQSVRLADSLLQRGMLGRAESLYYAAARARPHDPVVRWSLGRFLVARGAPRVGATLMEEAIKFGGEPTMVGRDLVPVYLATGEYSSLAALPAASASERARAKYLASRAPRTIAPDSQFVAVFHPSPDTTAIGHIPIRFNGHTLDATVSTRVQGIVISDTSAVAKGAHKFGTLAVVDSLGIGRLTIRDVPVSVEHLADRQTAIVGLAFLGRFAPTFDPAAARFTLRAAGQVPVLGGDHLVTWNAGSDYRVLQAGGWISLNSPTISRLLRERRWTLDARRGQIVAEP